MIISAFQQILLLLSQRFVFKIINSFYLHF